MDYRSHIICCSRWGMLYKWDLGKLQEARTVTTPDTLFPLE